MDEVWWLMRWRGKLVLSNGRLLWRRTEKVKLRGFSGMGWAGSGGDAVVAILLGCYLSM